LSLTVPQIEIFAYDPAENLQSVNYDNGCKIRIHHCPQFYTGDGKEFDAIIDDRFIGGHGIDQVKWKSKVWSKKRHTTGDAQHLWSMCFHVSEGREFESERNLARSRFTSCFCPTCRVADVFCEDVAGFRLIRALLHMVELQSCEKYTQYQDLALFSTQFHTIASGLVLDVITPAESRVAQAVSTVLHCAVVEAGKVRLDVGSKRPYDKNHKPRHVQLPHVPIDPDFITCTEKTYPHFTHKRVDFFGVSPLVLGSTPICRRMNRQQGGSEIAFVYNQSSIHLALKALEIWAPPDLKIPGFTQSLDQHFMFYKYQRNKVLPFLMPLEKRKVEINPLLAWKEVLPVQTVSKDFLRERARKRQEAQKVTELPKAVDPEFFTFEEIRARYIKQVPPQQLYTSQYKEGEMYLGIGRPFHFQFPQDVVLPRLISILNSSKKLSCHKDKVMARLKEEFPKSNLELILSKAIATGAVKETADGLWQASLVTT